MRKKLMGLQTALLVILVIAMGVLAFSIWQIMQAKKSEADPGDARFVCAEQYFKEGESQRGRKTFHSDL